MLVLAGSECQRGGARTCQPVRRSAGQSARPGASTREHEQDRELTVTIPLDRVAAVVGETLRGAGRALSSLGGLPVYAGLGVLAAADVIAWPAAVTAGLGYAVLRWWGPFGHQESPPRA